MSIGKYIIRFWVCGFGKTEIGTGLWQVRMGIVSITSIPVGGRS
jgi:hypothetical protein